MGTAANKAPQPARGKAVDKRADIWAFGVVLHEMLTGHRLFRGEDVSEILAAVLKEEPKWDGSAPAEELPGERSEESLAGHRGRVEIAG